MIDERDEVRYRGFATESPEPIGNTGGNRPDFGADGLTETVADLDYYKEQDRKKIVYGSLFFLIIVVIHVGMGFFLNIESTTVAIIVTQLMILIPAFIYMGCYKVNPFKFMRFKKFHLGSVFLIPLFMFSVLPVMGLINLISQLFATNIIQTSMEDVLVGGLGSSLLLIAVLPGFVEEATFRGAIYGSLRGCRPVRGIILSGFLFGLMHMNFNQFMYATALGIVMGLLIEATGSILSTMILHFCFNANSVILLWALPKIQNMLKSMMGDAYNYDDLFDTATKDIDKEMLINYIGIFIPIAVVGAAFAFLFFYLIAKLNNRWYYICFLFSSETKMQRESFPKPKVINVFLIIGIIICFGMCILNELIVKGVIS